MTETINPTQAEHPQTIHLCPPKGSGLMPCCGRTPFEVVSDRLTLDEGEVTCKMTEHPAPPWDHPYESADQSMACRHCGWVGSYAHTAEFYQKWVFPALSGVQERPLLGTYERETLAEHRDDGNGGCLVCRIWKPGEYDDDGESELLSMMSWPCPTVRLARAQERPPIDVERLGWVIYEMGIDDLNLPDAEKLAAHILARLSGSVGEP